MKYKKGRITLFVISILMGFITTVMIYQSPKHNMQLNFLDNVEESSSLENIRRLQEQRKRLEQKKDELRSELIELEKRISEYESKATESSSYAKKIQDDLVNARILAGLTDLKGPGVEVVLNDAKKETIPDLSTGADINWYLVHDVDVLRVVNELLAAGAEAVSINDTRIISNTRIRCGGPTINVKDRPLAPPFVIKAIGDPDALENFLMNPPENSINPIGIYQELTSYGIQFSIKKVDELQIPRYYGTLEYKYAVPVSNKEGES